jgi:putative acetyltransferase
MNVTVREFQPADARAVSDVIGRTMRESNGADYAPEILAPLIEYFAPAKVLLLAQERICLVAEIDKKIVGTIALEGAELCTFFVHPDFQRKGVGTRLLKALEETALKNGIKIISLATSLTAVSFYEKTGYRKNGIEIEETAGRQIGMEKILADRHGAGDG